MPYDCLHIICKIKQYHQQINDSFRQTSDHLLALNWVGSINYVNMLLKIQDHNDENLRIIQCIYITIDKHILHSLLNYILI